MKVKSDHCSKFSNLAIGRKKPEKHQGFNGIRTTDTGIAEVTGSNPGIAEVTGLNPVEALMFFRLLPSNCLHWKIYCDDHS